MVAHPLSLSGGLLGDAVPNLSRRRKNAGAVADLGESAQTSDRCGCGERLQVSVVNFRCEASRSERIKAHVLIEFERESIRADSPMECDEHLALLCVAHALNRPNQPRTLRHEKLLVVVRVVV